MQKIKIGVLFALCFTAIASTNVSAADDDTILTVNADVTTKISLILNQEQVNFSFEDGEFQSSNVTITGSTNSSRGYKISVQANLPYTELKHQKITILDNIPTISEPMQSSAFPESGWGYSTDATLFKPLTIEPTTAYVTAVNGRVDHTFTTGIKASTTLPAGIYTNELLFSIVANPTATSLEMAYEDSGAERVTVGNGEYFTMQDMTPLICAMTDDIPSEIQAVDVRDNKLYWITKLADGHCWMTQNLDFDLDANVALTSDTTNLKTVDSWTPIESTTTVSEATSHNDYNLPHSLDTGDMYSYNGNELKAYPFDQNGQHGHIGNLYTWAAALATNNADVYIQGTDGHPENTPQDSICPKGWRLPTTTANSPAVAGSDNEWGRINYLYNENRSDTTAGLDNAPLYLNRARLGYGYYGIFASNNAGDGYYWTPNYPEKASYSVSPIFAYYVRLNSTTYNNLGISYDVQGRGTGISIRCIAE